MTMNPTVFVFNWHPVLVLFIIVITGFFGGIINYYYSFEGDNSDKNRERFIRCVLLSVGASLLVPSFLQMISSPIIEKSTEDSNLYLILIGFCLVFAIFSRRFITSIGERILASVKEAKENSEESVRIATEAKLETSSTKEQIKDLDASINLNNNLDNTEVVEPENTSNEKVDVYEDIIYKINSYLKETTIPDYSQRVNVKSQIGREMGLMIINNNLDKGILLGKADSEGAYLAICYAIKLQPRRGDFLYLNKIGSRVNQMFTKYHFCEAIDKLVRVNALSNAEYNQAKNLIERFKYLADNSLLSKINETTSLINRYAH